MRTPLTTVLTVAAVGLLAGCGTIPQTSSSASTAAPAQTTSVPSDATSPSPAATSTPDGGDGGCDYTVTGQASKKVNPPSDGNVATSGTATYVLKMTEGDVKLTLDRNAAPCTVHSFESLADQGFYDNTRCHRLADSGIFILQCGDPTGTGSGGPGYSYPDELDGTETYPRGTVAMANSGPNTNGSQFFLVWDDSKLGPNYTVFGKMDTKSVEVIAAIASQGQDGSYGDGTGKPNSDALIKSVVKG